MEVNNLKLDVVRAIQEVEVPGLNIGKFAAKPKVFNELPCIVYSLIHESIDMNFKSVGRERATFQIDIWANKQSDISKILIVLKKTMLNYGFYYVRGMDFNDPSEIKRFITNFEKRN